MTKTKTKTLTLILTLTLTLALTLTLTLTKTKTLTLTLTLTPPHRRPCRRTCGRATHSGRLPPSQPGGSTHSQRPAPLRKSKPFSLPVWVQSSGYSSQGTDGKPAKMVL